MNTFLLFITIGLLLLRIKNMPSMLSKDKYYKKLEDNSDKAKQGLKFYNSDLSDKIFNISTWLVIILYGLISIYYVVIGTYINNFTFSILTLLQLGTVIVNCSRQKLTLNIEDHVFHRWLFLVNVVLDIIYYPAAIYLLIK